MIYLERFLQKGVFVIRSFLGIVMTIINCPGADRSDFY